VHQLVVKYVERDIIVVTKPHKGAKHGLRVRTDFPKFQDLFTVIVEHDAPESKGLEEPRAARASTATSASPRRASGRRRRSGTALVRRQHCVGKFFDTGGYFWEQGLVDTVQKMVNKFESKKAD
jgi:hypothetical protein